MISQTGAHDLVVPVTASGFESLHAVYSRKCLPVIESQIEKNELKVSHLFGKFKTREIHGEELRRFDPEGKLFANLNRPDDLSKVIRP